MIERKNIVTECMSCLSIVDVNFCSKYINPSVRHISCTCPAKVIVTLKKGDHDKKYDVGSKKKFSIEGKFSGGIHAFWRVKRNSKKTKFSRTPGSQKHENCRATQFERFCVTRSRSYKHPNYHVWLVSTSTKK